jgi:hypothetical protein
MRQNLLLHFWPLLFVISFVPAIKATLPEDYTSMSAKDKEAILWNKISDSAYDEDKLPSQNFNMANLSKIFSPAYSVASFMHRGDEMPGQRQKIIHTYGSVCKAQLVITAQDSPYTGIFQSGGLALLRASTPIHGQSNHSISPTLALKILIDGQESQNLVLANLRTGQSQDGNFFASSLFNIRPATESPSPIDEAFQASLELLPGSKADKPESALNMGLFEQAAVSANGQKVMAINIVTPYMVTLTPNAALGWEALDGTDYRLKLANIAEGSLLYNVSARQTMDGEDQVIGQLISTSAFIASVYGDEHLFFNHARKPWKAASSSALTSRSVGVKSSSINNCANLLLLSFLPFFSLRIVLHFKG